MNNILNLKSIEGVLVDYEEFPLFVDHWIYAGHAVSGHGKRRRISAPNKPMLALHKRLVEDIREVGFYSPSATGCKEGSSPYKNVMRHSVSIGKKKKKIFPRYFYLLDLKSAYENIQIDLLVEAMEHFFPVLKGQNVKKFLLGYCIHPEFKGLYAGSPSSPDLFNLYCEYVLDRDLRELCEKHGLIYTRYLDDLTFSSSRPIGIKKRKQICQLIRRAQFDISPKKALLRDLDKGPICINGIGIRKDGSTFLPRKNAEEISSLLHRANLQLQHVLETYSYLPFHSMKEFLEVRDPTLGGVVSLVNGKMGLFYSTCGRVGKSPSALERKIRQRHEVFLRLIHKLKGEIKVMKEISQKQSMLRD